MLWRFHFPRATCEACPLFARCVRSKTEGRTLTSHYHEAILRAAQAQQATPEFKTAYRRRAAIERKIADVVQHGERKARYVGRLKVRLQGYLVGAVVNVKRLFTLFKGDMGRMQQVLATL